MALSTLKRFLKNGLILGIVLLVAPFFCLAIWLNKHLRGAEKLQNILVIDNAKIGDLICATPVFRVIKERYPMVNLTVLVIPRVEGILRGNKNIDRIIISSLNVNYGIGDAWRLAKTIKNGQFNVCLNLVPGTLNYILPFFCLIPKRITSSSRHHSLFFRCLSLLYTDRINWPDNTLSLKHYLELLKPIGIQSENIKKEVVVSDQAKAKAEDFLRQKGFSNQDVLVGFSLTAGNKIKEWNVENFARLAEMIADRYGYKIIAIGALADRKVLDEFNHLTENRFVTTSDFLLDELAGLISRFDYFISVDSGPLYIANALGVPVLNIIGPYNYLEQAPYYEVCEIVKADGVSCWPCLHMYSTITACPLGHRACLTETTPGLAFDFFEKLIARYGKK